MLFYITFLILVTRGGGVSRIMVVSFLFMKGLGWVDSLGSAARASRLHVF